MMHEHSQPTTGLQQKYSCRTVWSKATVPITLRYIAMDLLL